MFIDREMVTLFFEIKRGLPTAQQLSMRISDDHVGENLVDLYNSSEDAVLKVLISAFFERAGGDWLTKIEPKRQRVLDSVRSSLKPDSEPLTNGLGSPKPKQKKQRFYRGAPVE